MKEKCELLNDCGFFNNFQGHTEVVKHGWIKIFCLDKTNSQMCKRKKIFDELGKPPVDNLTPTGVLLPH